MFIAHGPSGAALFTGDRRMMPLTEEFVAIMRSIPGMQVKSCNQREWDVVMACMSQGIDIGGVAEADLRRIVEAELEEFDPNPEVDTP